MRRVAAPIAILLAACLVAGCGKDAPLSRKPVTTASVATATSTVPKIAPRSAHDGCTAVAPAVARKGAVQRPRRKLDPRHGYVVVLETNCGTIRVLLAIRRAPRTTASFAGLVREGFYDGLSFHRIAKPGGNDYVIQGGDPQGNGNGGPGYSVVETPSPRTRYVRGVVAMAKTATDPPGTSGSQFFIVTAAEAPLPSEYAVLGRVSGGEGVVSRIARLETDPVSEMPIDPVVIRRARLLRR